MQKINAIHKVRSALHFALAWLVYTLSFLVPRDPHLWIFLGWHRAGGHEHFADNSKYLFLYASLHGGNEVHPVWLSPDPTLVEKLRTAGYRAEHQGSLRGAYYALRAGYTVIDSHISFEDWKYIGRSKVIQLWHGGVPTKLIGFQTPKHTPPSRLISPNWWAHPYLYCATSELSVDIMSEAFRSRRDKVYITGHQRNDVLVENIRGAEIDILELPALERARTGPSILYAPTYRQDGSNPLDQINLPRMFEFLERHDAVLHVQLHPKFAAYKPDWDEQFAARIIFITGGNDIYPRLRDFDICITDYSSTATDFLFFNRPIVHYQYDLEEYQRTTGLQARAAEIMPGVITKTFEELLAALENVVAGEDAYASERARALALAFKDADGKSCERIFKILQEDMGGVTTTK
jgi:CDP-glycerol glycerophosphotransferase (TagB/SpsB family)